MVTAVLIVIIISIMIIQSILPIARFVSVFDTNAAMVTGNENPRLLGGGWVRRLCLLLF